VSVADLDLALSWSLKGPITILIFIDFLKRFQTVSHTVGPHSKLLRYNTKLYNVHSKTEEQSV